MTRNDADDLLQRAKSDGAPVVDGGTATFVWEGDEPPYLIGDFNHWARHSPTTALQPLASGLWAHRMTLPSDAYLEYSYLVGNERAYDPLNPRVTSNGVGGSHNWFAMPDFSETPLSEEGSGPRGILIRHDVECGLYAVGNRRTVHLYRPPTDDPCPLLVVLDGQDYLHRGKIVPIVDNLIAEERIYPLNLALVDHGNQARYVEYNCSDATVTFLKRVILPLAQEQLNLAEDASLNGVLGASMGGLMALYTALRAPRMFGRVLSQSGAFSAGYQDFESVIYDAVRHAQARPAIWMSAGRYETLARTNRRMHDLLGEKGYDATYREYNGGHNYACWRNDVWRAIEALYGR